MSNLSMSGSGGSRSPLAVETSCRRVTAEDLAAVTPDDIASVAKGMSDEEFKAALRVLADLNKVGLVLTEASPQAMGAALQCVKGPMIKEAKAKTQTSAAMQALLLANSTEQLREASAVTVERLRASGDLFS